MNDQLFKDIQKSKNIIIIGLGVLGSPNVKKNFQEALFSRVADKKVKCIIIAESDNQFFQFSLLTDISTKDRVSFEEFKIRRNYFYNELSKIQDGGELIDFKITSLNIPAFIVKLDNSIWHLPLSCFDIDDYVKLDKKSKIYSSINSYAGYLINADQGGKYSTKYGAEMLELFDQKHVPRGIFPRDSFYGTDHYQYVIWGLVFNREGKLLIHKRKDNAKDNQNMWDKSIGGHIDFNIERSSQDAAGRELIEELFTKENKQQSGHAFSMLSEDIEKVYFLGDWRIENYGVDYLNQLKLLEAGASEGEENWVFYKIPNSFSHNTPRLLPDGKGERWLRVIVDSYIFIANTSVTEETVTKMENSEFLLVEPRELKTWIEQGKKDIKSDNDDDYTFDVTPDLKYIMTGNLRDVIEEVSLTIKYSDLRK